MVDLNEICSKKQTVVVVSGYFNPIHSGHINLFNEAKKLGDRLIVIINNDKQVELKGSQKFMNQNERKSIIEAIKYVDQVIISIDEDETQAKTLEFVKPTIFANGGDRTGPVKAEDKICNELGIDQRFNIGGGKIRSSSELVKNAKKHTNS